MALIIVSTLGSAPDYLFNAERYAKKDLLTGQYTCGPSVDDKDCNSPEHQAMMIMSYLSFFKARNYLTDYKKHLIQLADSDVTMGDEKTCNSLNVKVCNEDPRGASLLALSYALLYEYEKDKTYLKKAEDFAKGFSKINALCPEEALPERIILYAKLYELTHSPTYNNYITQCNLNEYKSTSVERRFWHLLAYIKLHDFTNKYLANMITLGKSPMEKECGPGNWTCNTPDKQGMWMIAQAMLYKVTEDEGEKQVFMDHLKEIADDNRWDLKGGPCYLDKRHICTFGMEQALLVLGYAFADNVIGLEAYGTHLSKLAVKAALDCPDKKCSLPFVQAWNIIALTKANVPSLSFFGINGVQQQINAPTPVTTVAKPVEVGTNEDLSKMFTTIKDKISLIEDNVTKDSFMKELTALETNTNKDDNAVLKEKAQSLLTKVENSSGSSEIKQQILIGLLILVAFFIVAFVVLMFKKRRGVATTKNVVEEAEVSLDLQHQVVYVVEQLKEGYNINDIKESLENSDYSEHVIAKLISLSVNEYTSFLLKDNNDAGVIIDILKEQGYDEEQCDQAKQFADIVDYLVTNFKQGYNKDNLAANLVESGYSEEDIAHRIKCAKEKYVAQLRLKHAEDDIKEFLREVGF